MKIMIIGRSGSGKSTFSLRLSKKLNLPVYHLDKFFFEEKWKERDYQTFIKDQLDLVSQSDWIIDGNSTKSFELRYARCDICFYFNFPRWLCYWRVFKRLWDKDSTIDDRAPKCPETIRWSLLKYMWGFEERVKSKLLALQKMYPKVQFIELKSDKDVKKFMEPYSRS